MTTALQGDPGAVIGCRFFESRQSIGRHRIKGIINPQAIMDFRLQNRGAQLQHVDLSYRQSLHDTPSAAAFTLTV